MSEFLQDSDDEGDSVTPPPIPLNSNSKNASVYDSEDEGFKVTGDANGFYDSDDGSEEEFIIEGVKKSTSIVKKEDGKVVNSNDSRVDEVSEELSAEAREAVEKATRNMLEEGGEKHDKKNKTDKKDKREKKEKKDKKEKKEKKKKKKEKA